MIRSGNGAAQQIFIQRLLGAHLSLVLLQMHGGPSAIQRVQRILNAGSTMIAGHAANGQHAMIRIMRRILICHRVAGRGVAAATAALIQLLRVALDRINHNQKQKM